MKFFITGGAGFIGSHLVDRLSSDGEVVVYDNLSLGKKEHLQEHLDGRNFKFYEADLLDFDILKKAMRGCDVVWHLAANSDISNNEKTDIDLKNGTLATYNVLEAMRLNGIKKIVFASSSAIYGEAKVQPTPENYGPLLPISLYGASKLASEALISAFCENFGFKAWIFRFANIVGKRGTHGVIVDFVKKLKKDSAKLEILGDGKQAKPYLEVKDCIDGMVFGFKNSSDKVNYFNLGCNGQTKVDTIANIVVKNLGLSDVEFKYTGKDRGWTGDVPRVLYDISKLSKLGWKAKYNSDEAVEVAVKDYLKDI
jgi:UDP-glucose 4-epimerase